MHTPGPWAVAWDFSIIPEAHKNRLLGAASDDIRDRDEYAQTIASVDRDRHGRGDQMANALLIALAPDLLSALIKLSNEVLGSMHLAEEAIRQDIGNTNYNLLIQRAEEARAVVAKATGA